MKDRQIKSGQRTGLDKRRQKVRGQQARLLLVQEEAEQRQRQRVLRIAELKGAAQKEPGVGQDPTAE